MEIESPEYPFRVLWYDGDVWELEDALEVEQNLEWFDSEDGDDVKVIDKQGRSVQLLVKAFHLLICKIKES